MATRADYFKLHFIVFLWGFSGILGKLVVIPAYEMVFFRGLLSALGIGIVMLFVGETFKVISKTIDPSDRHRIYCSHPLAGFFRVRPRLKCFGESCGFCYQFFVDRSIGTVV